MDNTTTVIISREKLIRMAEKALKEWRFQPHYAYIKKGLELIIDPGIAINPQAISSFFGGNGDPDDQLEQLAIYLYGVN